MMIVKQKKMMKGRQKKLARTLRYYTFNSLLQALRTPFAPIDIDVVSVKQMMSACFDSAARIAFWRQAVLERSLSHKDKLAIHRILF